MEKYKGLISVILVTSLIMPAGKLSAKDKRGVDLVIKMKNGWQVSGELIVVKERSLLLTQSQSGAFASVNVDDIRTITIMKRSKVGEGMIGGLLAGGLFGVLIGLSDGDDEPGMFAMTSGEKALWAGFIFGVSASLLALIGGTSRTSGIDYRIQLDGKPESQLKFELDKLCSKARIKDYR